MNNNDKQQLFLDNKNLIYFCLKKYFPHIYYNINSREEYYQIGAIGLLKAINNYKSNIASFSTYAIPMIWGEIKRTNRDSTPIHYSRTIIEIANKLMLSYNENNVEDNYESWLNSQISKLDISEHEKMGVKNYILKPINLEFQYTDDDDKMTVVDKISSAENVTDIIEYIDYIDNISKHLSDREQTIFDKFLKGESQMSIGDEIGISQAQVSRIQRKIKILTIKELYKAEQHDTAFNMICKLHNNNMSDIRKFASDYQIDISKYLNEKRIDNVKIDKDKFYSKKSCQKIILKCIIKLILSNVNLNDIKTKIKKLLNTHNYDYDIIINHLDSLTNSQLKSCIDLAEKTIKKYNYVKAYQITIDESDFKLSDLIIKNKNNEFCKPNYTDLNKIDNNLIDSIISLLESFKLDNSTLKFEL